MTTQMMLHTGRSSSGRINVDRLSRVFSARGPMLHQPTGSPSSYPITPGGFVRSQSARNADSRFPSPSSVISPAVSRCDRHQQWLSRLLGFTTATKSSTRSGVTGRTSSVIGGALR